MSIRLLAMAAGGGLFTSSSSQQNTADSTSLVIYSPPGIIDGDLLIAIMGSDNTAGGHLWSGDTGWTERADEDGAPSLRIATKVASSESGDYTFTSANSELLAGVILAFRGYTYDTIGAFDEEVRDNDIVAPTITPATVNSILFAIYLKNDASETFTTPTGMVPYFTDSDAYAPSIAIFSETVDDSATGTRTSTPASADSSDTAGILLAINPS